ncbi:MAG: DinB family protein [Chitinophagaceae bacterium]
MDNRSLFLIGDLPGFTPQIGRLVSMLNYVRHTTFSTIEGLTVRELDYLCNPEDNSIGSLLLHIAATELSYQSVTFHNRALSSEEKRAWEAAFTLGDKASIEIAGQDLNYYLSRLTQVRTITLEQLALRDDKWLAQQTAFGNDYQVNNYFKWFHVLSHELNHRGQIRMLKRQAMNRGGGI